jgi:hypothetical protein
MPACRAERWLGGDPIVEDGVYACWFAYGKRRRVFFAIPSIQRA